MKKGKVLRSADSPPSAQGAVAVGDGAIDDLDAEAMRVHV
jgi:hypothetical protein